MALNLNDIEGLSPEHITEINSRHEADVNGLKAKNAELVARESDAKAARDAADEARAAAEEQSKIDLAEQNKDIEGLKNAMAERDARIAERDAKIREQEQFAQKAAEQSTLDAAKVEFMKGVAPDAASQMYMERQFLDNVDVQNGQVVPVNAEGVWTGKGLNELSESLKSNIDNAPYISSPAGSGGSANGSGNTRGGAADFSKMTKTEQSVYLNENPGAAAQVLNS